MVRAAAVTAVAACRSCAATVRRSTAVVTAASATVVSATATTTAAVEAAPSATAMTATTMLREGSWRAKQRYCSESSEENLETSGPNHVCDLHPTTSPTMRAAGTPEPFYTN
jgi:hypothetical protein